MSYRNQELAPQEQIAQRAYEMYLDRGGEDGHDIDDWLTAETKLSEKYSSPTQRTRSAAAGHGQSAQTSEADSKTSS